MRQFFLACTSLLSLIFSGFPGSTAADGTVLLPPVEEEDFAALKGNSPFLRVLKLEETYAMRGLATMGGITHLTLQHRETKKTITVTSSKENELGMRLLTVSGSKPEDMAVKIAFAGSEFEFAYEAAILEPQSTFTPGTRDTIRRDREGRIVTSNELVKKWHPLSHEHRRSYDLWKEKLLRARPDLRYSEKRFPLAHKALNAFKTGRPPPSFR